MTIVVPKFPPPCNGVFGQECAHCTAASVHQFAARAAVFAAGADARQIFIIHQGLLKLTLGDRAGREFVLELLGPGEVAGTEAAFAEQYAATATALEPTVVCTVRCETVQQQGPAARFVCEATARQLARARRHQQTLGSFRVRDKVVRHLLEYVQGDSRGLFYQRRLALRDMANLIGSTAESVCRALAELEADGIIASERNRIRILSPKKLRVSSS